MADPGTGSDRHFTKEDTQHFLRDRRNWGPWKDDDEMGALNLITPAKRIRAAS